MTQTPKLHRLISIGQIFLIFVVNHINRSPSGEERMRLKLQDDRSIK